MERDPREFDRREADAPRDEGEDDIDRVIARLSPAPGIKHIDEDEHEDLDDVDAAIAEGRAYPHEIVGVWLRTWGQPDQKPFKEWLADRDG